MNTKNNDNDNDCVFCTTDRSAGVKARVIQVVSLLAIWIVIFSVNHIFIKDVNIAMISGFLICLVNQKLGANLSKKYQCNESKQE